MKKLIASLCIMLIPSVGFADETSDILARNNGGSFAQTLVKMDIPLAIAMGKMDRFDKEHKFGSNPDIDGGQTEDVWGAGGSMVWLSTAIVINAVSSDAADSVGLTGADSITVTGLDANYLIQEETIALHGSGGTTLPVTAGTYLRVHRVRVVNSGSAGSNVGNITLYAATTDSIQAYIAATEGQTTQALYTVPANYQYGFIHSGFYSVGGGAATQGDVKLFTRPLGESWQLKDIISLTANSQYIPYAFPILVSPKTDIRLSMTSSTANSVASGFFDVILYDSTATQENKMTSPIR